MVYTDINKSNYKFTFKDELTFYFSSEFYLNKFTNEFVEYLNNETIKLRIKYNCVVTADEMILLTLYRKIEKRGFRVYYNNKKLSKELYYNISLGSKSFTG